MKWLTWVPEDHRSKNIWNCLHIVLQFRLSPWAQVISLAISMWWSLLKDQNSVPVKGVVVFPINPIDHRCWRRGKETPIYNEDHVVEIQCRKTKSLSIWDISTYSFEVAYKKRKKERKRKRYQLIKCLWIISIKVNISPCVNPQVSEQKFLLQFKVFSILRSTTC